MNPNDTNPIDPSATIPSAPTTTPITSSSTPVITPTASNINPTLPPTYSEMLKEMGTQLNARKGLLLKRVLFIIWPFLLVIVGIYVGNELNERGMLYSVTHLSENGLMYACWAYLVCAAIYVWAAGFLFEIEKQIWIDSHFDKKDLTPKQSWKIAKKLFWPAFRLRLRIAWQYYFLPALVFVAILVGLGFWANNSEISATYQSNIWILSTILFLIFLIGAIIYSYYIKVKIRYSWFVFIDIYKGEPFDTRVVLSQMNALNTASKSASFKKALVTEIGTDSATVIANLAVSTIGFGISQVPGVGQLLGGLTRAYGQELTKQAASLGKISAMYLLYRFARKELFGSEQVNNEYVYGLINK
jgi:hypothetical protein